ncbi:hypothetical protein DRH14_03905 [Candidatus Shapirobacteria bacterium]|nr:MAG: hypothetical protein DRH14_03905 [Candidatus Shapirobacteria bacterium]
MAWSGVTNNDSPLKFLLSSSMKPVIMCGGIGTKMWPLSRQAMPKHFLPFFNGQSLFQKNYQALLLKFSPQQIFVQTNVQQAKIAQQQAPDIPLKNYFIEPEMRNQGPASGFTAAMLYQQDPNEPFILVQADTLRLPASRFVDMIDLADDLAQKTNKYVTGIFKSNRLVDGVDYLEVGKSVNNNFDINVFEVNHYLDRSQRSKIASSLQQGTAFIHSNHTCMTPRSLLNMYKQYRPDWYQPLMKIIETGQVAKYYSQMPKGAIEEVTKNLYENGQSLVIELPFEWIDFGTWDSVADFYQRDKSYQSGNHIQIDGSGNYIQNPHKLVATIGVSDLIVVDTDDALLIVKKGQSRQVSQVVDYLKDNQTNRLR